MGDRPIGWSLSAQDNTQSYVDAPILIRTHDASAGLNDRKFVNQELIKV
jgi:hypothetical protein